MMELLRVVEYAEKDITRLTNRDKYFNDPALWIQDVVGITLWSKQREVAQSIITSKNVAVKAGHGVGKSFLVALLICWWMDTRYPAVFVASTAPSTAQIGAIVWRYVRQIKSTIAQRHKDGLIEHELPGYITSDNQWKLDGGTILGFGRKPPDNKEDDAFQGLHDGYVLAIADESVGLSEAMIDALGNITSNDDSRRIIVCNPTNPASYTAKLFKDQPEGWVFHTISVFDSPNFKSDGEGLPKDALQKLVGPSYVEDKKAEYGENSARYKARVLGEFAWDEGNPLITPEDLAIAHDNEIVPDPGEPRILGVDVARFGEDSSVIYFRQGGHVRFVDEIKEETRTTETAKWVHQHAVDLAVDEVRIDMHGIGGGVIDYIVTEIPNRRYAVREMNSNQTPPDKRRWHNGKAYWWDKFRMDIRDGLFDLDPLDETLSDELVTVSYKFQATTEALLMETKEDLKKRGVQSPNRADSCVYACADVDGVNVQNNAGGTIYTDHVDFTDEPLFGLPTYLEIMRYG